MFEIDSGFKDKELSRALLRGIEKEFKSPVRFMEVCGTHTMSIFRYGIRGLLPEGLFLVSGPGCPVCVTSQGDIDLIIELSKEPEIIISTFGDLLRVPGSRGSLMDERARGSQVNVVYSPSESLEICKKTPEKEVVFIAIGFETTVPTVAATILEARAKGIKNFSILCLHKTMPEALRTLLEDEELGVNGLLAPGHVSAIIGARPYRMLSREFNMPIVIAGFEPADILQGILLLLRQLNDGRADVQNGYKRAVPEEGNLRALSLIKEVFEPCESTWRGLGKIEGSGLRLKEEYGEFDAMKRFGLSPNPSREPKACLCGEIIKAKATPLECPLFKRACTPLSPVGPCMVSSEGTCSAFYKYGLL